MKAKQWVFMTVAMAAAIGRAQAADALAECKFLQNNPLPKQSVTQTYVAPDEVIACARALTIAYYAQPIPPGAVRLGQDRSYLQPSMWPSSKHDNPQSLGNGYSMQLVYPKPGIVCSVSRVEATGQIVNSDCQKDYNSAAGYPTVH